MWPLLAIALAPGITIMVYIYWRDKSDREPFKHLLISFLLGVLSAVIAVFIEVPLDRLGVNIWGFGSALSMVFKGFIVAAIVEELCKFAMLRLYAYPKKAFNEPLDGIVYGVTVAMGFATIENVGYVLQDPDNGMATGILRMFLAVPGHACWGAVAGYFLGKSKFSSSKKMFYIFFGLFVAILLHGTYDTLLFLKDSNEFRDAGYDIALIGGALTTALLGYILAFIALRRHRKISKQMFPLDKNAPTEDDEIFPIN